MERNESYSADEGRSVDKGKRWGEFKSTEMVAEGEGWKVFKCTEKIAATVASRLGSSVESVLPEGAPVHDAVESLSREAGRKESPLYPSYQIGVEHVVDPHYYGRDRHRIRSDKFYTSSVFLNKVDGQPTMLLYVKEEYLGDTGDGEIVGRSPYGRFRAVPLVWDSQTKTWWIAGLETASRSELPGIGPA